MIYLGLLKSGTCSPRTNFSIRKCWTVSDPMNQSIVASTKAAVWRQKTLFTYLSVRSVFLMCFVVAYSAHTSFSTLACGLET